MREVSAIPAVSIGPVAAEILAQGGDLEVIAVHERSFYVMLRHGIACVGGAGIGNGPINVLIAGERPPWDREIGSGLKGICSNNRLTLGGGFAVDVGVATIWSPPPQMFWSPDSLARGLSWLEPQARKLVPIDGVAALVFAPTGPAARTPTARAAASLVESIRSALPVARATGNWTGDAVRAATLLIGLGPGLTPSGDDFLGGLMLGLSARREAALRDALFEAISGELDDLTVPVSAMHLAAAADGLGHEAVHHLINALVAGDDTKLPEALATVAALGATSGMDAVAGLAVGLSE